MALKGKLEKAEFEALSEGLREHYKEVEGAYILDTDGFEGIKNTFTATRKERDEMSAKNKALQEQIDEMSKKLPKDPEPKKKEKSQEDTPPVTPGMEELQKQMEALKAELEENKAKAAAAELDALKTKVGIELGLPQEISDRLRGGTLEELKADAEKLKGCIPEAQKGFVIGGGGNPPPTDKSIKEKMSKGEELAKEFNDRRI